MDKEVEQIPLPIENSHLQISIEVLNQQKMISLNHATARNIEYHYANNVTPCNSNCAHSAFTFL